MKKKLFFHNFLFQTKIKVNLQESV